MNTTLKLPTWISLAGIALLSAASGCATDGSEPKDFFPQHENHALWKLNNSQLGNGARNDATMYKSHFTNGKLNSLGKQKLNTMLKDRDPADPAVVYVDLAVPENQTGVQRLAVANFLKDNGVAEDMAQVKYGSNPDTKSMTAEGLTRMGKTESTSAGAAASSDSGAATSK